MQKEAYLKMTNNPYIKQDSLKFSQVYNIKQDLN